MAENRSPARNDQRPRELDPRREAWDRQPQETDVAYEAFLDYRDAAHKRSLRGTAKKLGKDERLVKRWSARWRWTERVDAWDRSLDEEYRKELISERRDMGRRHARVAQGVMAKVVERLRTLRPEEMSPSQLIHAFEAAAKVERQALGIGDTTIVTVGGDTQVRHAHADEQTVARAARDFLEQLTGQLADAAASDGTEVVDAEVVTDDELPVLGTSEDA